MMSFFRELGQTLTKGDTEAAIEINTRACEAILADQIKLFDQFHESHGPGVLVLKLADGDRNSHYTPLADWCADLSAAESAGDVAQSDFLKEVIRSIQTNNYDQRVLILLVDKSSVRLLPVPRDYPAKAIQDLQKQFTV
jgi:hypothetical protein